MNSCSYMFQALLKLTIVVDTTPSQANKDSPFSLSLSSTLIFKVIWHKKAAKLLYIKIHAPLTIDMAS